MLAKPGRQHTLTVQTEGAYASERSGGAAERGAFADTPRSHVLRLQVEEL